MSFLDTYAQFSADTEIPKSYTLYTGLGVLSALAGGKVWVDMGSYVTSPQLYVCLVGPPGNLKSSALDVGENLMRQMGTVKLSSDSLSYRALIEEIKENETEVDFDGQKRVIAPLTCCLTELSNFLLNGGPQTIDICTTIYGKRLYKYKTQWKGTVDIAGPYLVIIGCATPAWITNRLKDDVISGGFSRRVLWVYETDGVAAEPFMERSPKQNELWATLLAMAKEIQKMKGKVKWSVEARDCYIDWTKRRETENRELLLDQAASYYLRTKHVQVQKIAMLLCLSNFSGLTLSAHHINGALKLLSLIENSLPVVFAGIGKNPNNASAVALVEQIERVGGSMAKAGVNTILFRDNKAMDSNEILGHLASTGHIELEGVNGTACFKVKKSFRPKITIDTSGL